MKKEREPLDLRVPFDCRKYLKAFSIQKPGGKPMPVTEYITLDGVCTAVDKMTDQQALIIANQVYQDLDWRATDRQMH